MKTLLKVWIDDDGSIIECFKYNNLIQNIYKDRKGSFVSEYSVFVHFMITIHLIFLFYWFLLFYIMIMVYLYMFYFIQY